MEPGSTASRLTARKRRAVALIAISVFALAAAGLTWIGPTLHLGDAANSKTTAANPVSTTPSPPPIVPTTYEFATLSVGWAVVTRPLETKVFKTVDGGKHWRLASQLAGSYGASIHFLDTTYGFLVTGNSGRAYRTTDGGAHWVQLVMPEGEPYSVTFTDRQRGSSLSLLARGRPVWNTTEDGGDTWRPLPDPPPDAYGPVFRNAEAWLSGYGSPAGGLHVYTSFDRGLAWSAIEVPRPLESAPAPAGPQFFGAQVWLLPGAGVAVLVSVGPACGKPAPCAAPGEGAFVSFNRGGTWTAVPLPPAAFTYRDIVYQDSVHWWALGSGFLFKSSDAGYTWQQISSTAPSGRPVLHVIDAQHAWAQNSMFLTQQAGGFQMSAVVATTDGGISWTRVPPPQTS